MTELRPEPARRYLDGPEQAAYETGWHQMYDHDSFRTLDRIEVAVDEVVGEAERCRRRAAMLEELERESPAGAGVVIRGRPRVDRARERLSPRLALEPRAAELGDRHLELAGPRDLERSAGVAGGLEAPA